MHKQKMDDSPQKIGDKSPGKPDQSASALSDMMDKFKIGKKRKYHETLTPRDKKELDTKNRKKTQPLNGKAMVPTEQVSPLSAR